MVLVGCGGDDETETSATSTTSTVAEASDRADALLPCLEDADLNPDPPAIDNLTPPGVNTYTIVLDLGFDPSTGNYLEVDSARVYVFDTEEDAAASIEAVDDLFTEAGPETEQIGSNLVQYLDEPDPEQRDAISGCVESDAA